MTDIVKKKIYRPTGSTALAQYIARAVELEIDKPTAEEITEALSVTIAFRAVTRRQSMKRAFMRDEVVDWICEQTGLDKEEVEFDTLEFDHSSELIIRMQAVDIISALAWDKCKGIEFGDTPPEWFTDEPDSLWQATHKPEDWDQAKDWFVTECLILLYEVNPQFVLGSGQVPFG